MSLTIELVEHIAALARLNLSEEEKTRFQEQLSGILEHFQELQAVDTSKVEDSPGLGLLESVLRDDQSEMGLELEKVLQNAPDAEKRQFKIPPVFEQ
jgi:aspartyl-tRNA(Asn)/glutamyl-tRNA(Gln) amidotransferase subunit C